MSNYETILAFMSSTMKPDNSFLRNPVHTETRIQLGLPCKLILPDQELQVVTFNISYSGFGVELPTGSHTLETKSVDSAYIEGIGDFEVYVRWKRGHRMGLSFSSKRNARPTLNAYFKKASHYPV